FLEMLQLKSLSKSSQKTAKKTSKKATSKKVAKKSTSLSSKKKTSKKKNSKKVAKKTTKKKVSKKPEFVKLAPRATARRLNKETRQNLLAEYMKRFEKVEPNPKCELYYETPYQLLVSVVLSAQTTDKMVNRCMEPLYKEGFTPEDVVKMGADGFLQKIRTIGLAPTKSKNVFKLSQMVIDSYPDRLPDNHKDLQALPGVGRKTANVILGEIFGHPTIAVDTHVYRVAKRLGLHREKTPEKAEVALLKEVDPKYLPKGHHWFILHGRYTCKSQSPLCDKCILSDICPSL
ncbi:endonuclease III, partial [bacterium]|nr:endonuclease III [bacterium]